MSVGWIKKCTDFFTILFSVGLPFVPFLNIPVITLLAVCNWRLIKSSNRAHRNYFSYMGFLSFIYVLVCTVRASDLIDLVFSLQILIKFYLLLIAGLLAGYSFIRSPGALFLWVVIQCFLIVGSIFDNSVYYGLLLFISPSAIPTFEDIFGLRSIGFGLYHVDGAIEFAFLCLLPLWFPIYKSRIMRTSSIFLSFLSMTMGRSSLFLIGIIGLVCKPIPLIATFIATVFASIYVPDDWGALHSGVELFRNLAESGTIYTESTNQNLEMFVLPESSYHWVFGYGKFFDSDGIFYQQTDLGWIRLILFGGIPFVMLYVAINLMLFKFVGAEFRKIKVALIACFIILNFKGIYLTSFFIGVLLSLSGNLTNHRLKSLEHQNA